MGFVVGAAVALGSAFASQLLFLVFHFIMSRIHGPGGGLAVHTDEDRSRSPNQRIKSIPYHHTVSRVAQVPKERGSTEWRSLPGFSGGRSAAETMSTIRTSLSSIVRPITSKTRLLPGNRSQRSSRRPPSLDSAAIRDHVHSTGDGFDSWDTSSVDPQNRQTVLESSSPPPLGRFLETIPASPTTSRSPSPGTPLDLAAPRTRRRSRSYSPAPSSSSLRETFTAQGAEGEAHIHPLFRSDSPTPPPLITPGTVVTAAPNAGQVIAHKQSIRSLARMRSGSLPPVPSPLCRQGSFDSFPRGISGGNSPVFREELEEEEEEAQLEAVAPAVTERKMTPPIPDWILSAGSRTSLTGYNSRKLRSASGVQAAEQV